MTCSKKKSLNHLYGYLMENVEDRTKTIDQFKSLKKPQQLLIVYNNEEIYNEQIICDQPDDHYQQDSDYIDSEDLDIIIESVKPLPNRARQLKKNHAKQSKLLFSISAKSALKYAKHKRRYVKQYFGSKTSRPKIHKSNKTRLKTYEGNEDSVDDNFSSSLKRKILKI